MNHGRKHGKHDALARAAGEEISQREKTITAQAERITRLEERLRITTTAVSLTALAMDATVELIRDLGHDLTDAPEERVQHFAALGTVLRETAQQARAVLDESPEA